MTSRVNITQPPRSLCRRCQRAESGCICQWIWPTTCATEVLILQHPMEVQHVKGSARLLSLSLTNSRIEVGETFAPQKLQALLSAPWSKQTAEQPQKQAILLYPELPLNIDHDASQRVLTPKQLTDPAQLRLVVIDGSWRKSRKMLYLNPLLQYLPRLRLTEVPTSKYLIRKAHRPDQLSSFEATCAALMQLEDANEKFANLLAAFDGFVAQQIQATITTREIFQNHEFPATHAKYRRPGLL